MKAYRTVTGRVVLFRPDQARKCLVLRLSSQFAHSLRIHPLNAERGSQRGRGSPDEHAARAKRCAPLPPLTPSGSLACTDFFVNAVKQVVIANMAFIPPEGKARSEAFDLFLQCLTSTLRDRSIFGRSSSARDPSSDSRPHPSAPLWFTPRRWQPTSRRVCEFHSPLPRHPTLRRTQGGQLSPIDLLVETQYHRAAPGGTGGTKCIGNYSPVLKTQLEAKGAGYSDVLYLDARENRFIEEVSSCNIFVVKGRRISTPALRRAFLPLFVSCSRVAQRHHPAWDNSEEHYRAGAAARLRGGGALGRGGGARRRRRGILHGT